MLRWLPVVFVLATGIAPAAADDDPEDVVATLWRALSHAPGAGADAATLQELFHDRAVVFGGRYANRKPVFRTLTAKAFIAANAQPVEQGFHECEIARQVFEHDRFATVLSVVESRTDPAARRPDYTGINAVGLHRIGDEWKIVSLHYHVDEDGDEPDTDGLDDGKSGRCLD